MGPFLHDCKWPTTVSLEVKHNTLNEICLVRHLAWSFHSTPCTHNQVFVHTFGSVHSLCTVAGLDNRNHCLLQLICGGPLDPSVSPTWYKGRVKANYSGLCCPPYTSPSWSTKLSPIPGRQAGLKTERSTLSSVSQLSMTKWITRKTFLTKL